MRFSARIGCAVLAVVTGLAANAGVENDAAEADACRAHVAAQLRDSLRLEEVDANTGLTGWCSFTNMVAARLQNRPAGAHPVLVSVSFAHPTLGLARFNSEYGHLVGGWSIREFAARLRRTFNPEAGWLLGYAGSSKFAVYADDPDPEDVLRLLRRMKADWHDMPLKVCLPDGTTPIASFKPAFIGLVARCPENGTDVWSLWKATFRRRGDDPVDGCLVALQPPSVDAVAALRAETEALERALADSRNRRTRIPGTDILLLPAFLEMSAAALTASPTGVTAMAAVDGDHFSQLIREHGVPFVDDVVVRMREILSRRLAGPNSWVTTLGPKSDEIYVFLTGRRDVTAVKNELEAALEEFRSRPFMTHAGTEVSVTFSVGVAIWNRNGQTVEQLFVASDRALKAAKDAGRNRVLVETADVEGNR